MDEFRYWRMTSQEVLTSSGTSLEGLSQKEARLRLARSGPNQIDKPDKKTPLKIFISQFQNPLIYILIAATIVAFALGDKTESLIILAILLVNAILGFVQEYRSEKALEELRKYVSMTARVMRDAQVSELPVAELVPGDIVLISIGDIVPADCRIIETHGLEANESTLTGESNPVSKTAEPLPVSEPAPHEMFNCIFMGTVITAGAGKAVVVTTGRDTFFGQSAKVLKEAVQSTDFEKSIRNFGSMLVRVILVMTLFVFIVNTILGHGILESFLFALAIAVGITPELLPVIITIGLSQGAMNLVRKHVAVKRLEAIEDLGNIDVLCADKTGTLTENEVSLIRYLDCEGKEDEEILQFSLLCNSAVVQHGKVKGGTIDSAIWTYALKKYDTKKLKTFHKVDEIAFDYERKRMSVVVDSEGDGRILITKGAPENVIPICTKSRRDCKEMKIVGGTSSLLKMAEGFGEQGYRVIAVAYRKPPMKVDYSLHDETDLIFAGFLILLDPPKKDAQPALEHFKRMGVALYVLTGDGPHVTAQICSQVGVKNLSGRILEGKDIEKLDEATLRKTVEANNIFARLTPSNKLAIINALRANGHIVGFIGDGVNDATSLKAADVGISVSNAADIAKDAADVVLLRKSLGVVANGISEGRKTFANIIKYIHNTISANFGNMFTLSLASLFLPFIPLLPSQILLNNLISDVPMLTVSTDSVDHEDMKKPKRWDISEITRFMIFFGLISSVFDLVTMAFIFITMGSDQAYFRTIWFIESALTEIFVVFAIRTFKPFWRSVPSTLLLVASALASAFTIGVIFSPLAGYFQFQPVSVGALAVVLGIVLTYVGVVEIAKHFFFKRYLKSDNHNHDGSHSDNHSANHGNTSRQRRKEPQREK